MLPQYGVILKHASVVVALVDMVVVMLLTLVMTVTAVVASVVTLETLPDNVGAIVE